MYKLWEYYLLLKKPTQRWFFTENLMEQKIAGLDRIAIEGKTPDIPLYIEFLLDSNIQIRQKVSETIIHLFQKIKSKKGYYNALKNCNIQNHHIEFYKKHFDKDTFIQLMCLTSLNKDGYIRQEAIKNLAGEKSARCLQFLIYRLTDWVEEVRQEAMDAINKYKSSDCVEMFVENLQLLEWLQKTRRVDINKFYSEILDFVVIENRENIIAKFNSYADSIRAIIAKKLMEANFFNGAGIHLILKDKYFKVRILALANFEKLNPNEIALLITDKSPKVRLQALYALQKNEIFDSVIGNYLADTSSTIRYFARFKLKESGLDFAEIYCGNLIENKQVLGSIIGLTEVNAKQDIELIIPFLHYKNIKVRKAAFLALEKFRYEDAVSFGLTHLKDNSKSFRNIIIVILAKAFDPEILKQARINYSSGGIEMKKSMLKLFSLTGGWRVIPDLMIGTMDENEEIRNLSIRYIDQWKIQTTNLYSNPEETDKIRARQIFSLAHSFHETKKYFRINPVLGLDFYHNR